MKIIRLPSAATIQVGRSIVKTIRRPHRRFVVVKKKELKQAHIRALKRYFRVRKKPLRKTDQELAAQFGLPISQVRAVRYMSRVLRKRGRTYGVRKILNGQITQLGGVDTIRKKVLCEGYTLAQLFTEAHMPPMSREMQRQIVHRGCKVISIKKERTPLWYICRRLPAVDAATVEQFVRDQEERRRIIAAAGGCLRLAKQWQVSPASIRKLIKDIYTMP